MTRADVKMVDGCSWSLRSISSWEGLWPVSGDPNSWSRSYVYNHLGVEFGEDKESIEVIQRSYSICSRMAVYAVVPEVGILGALCRV